MGGKLRTGLSLHFSSSGRDPGSLVPAGMQWERAVGLRLHPTGPQSRGRGSLLCRSCQWNSRWKTPCLEDGILGLRVLLFPKTSLPHTAHLVSSRNPGIISLCTDAEMTLLSHIPLSPGSHGLLPKARAHHTTPISSLFLAE